MHSVTPKLTLKSVAGIVSLALAGVAFLCAGLLSGCVGGQYAPNYNSAVHGYAPAGKKLIAKYQCGQCHTIPGIPGAHGVFGPPLNFIARRTELAGNFANTPDNLVHWIAAPTSMKPKTAMPDLGLSQREARDVAAYLESLQ